ncbi:MAG: cupin domain-containing protein [Steroidobacteraceae bacterium]
MSEKISARMPANTGKHLARGFIDLRAFASAAVPPNAGGNAYLRARDRVALPPGPISVAAGFVEADGTVEDLGADEFIVVVEGRLEVRWPNGTFTLHAGQSAVLPRGASFAWAALRPSRLIVMSHVGDMADHGEPILIDQTAELEPSSPPPAELLVGPTPNCRNHGDFRSATGEFVCGVWDSTPYHRRSMFFRHYELMHLLEGAVTLEDAAGHTATFSKGDILLMVQGSSCSWRSECHVTKVYATFRPGP